MKLKGRLWLLIISSTQSSLSIGRNFQNSYTVFISSLSSLRTLNTFLLFCTRIINFVLASSTLSKKNVQTTYFDAFTHLE